MLKNKKANKKKKGFTLIELIVVLAVLAIIALIAIPNFNGIRENSKVKADERSIALIEKAVETLIQEDDGTPVDGTYTYSGGTVTGSDANSVTELGTVLGTKIADPQQDGMNKFNIVIAGVGGATPTVTVTAIA